MNCPRCDSGLIYADEEGDAHCGGCGHDIVPSPSAADPKDGEDEFARPGEWSVK